MMKDRVAVLVCQEGALLLMHRVKGGREYYAIPGGKVEAGETLEETGRREILEELSLTVEVGPILWQQENQGRMETYFQATKVSGEVALGGPELQRQSARNHYRPEWVRLADLGEIDLLPESAKRKVLDLVRRGDLGCSTPGDVRPAP